MKANLF